MLIKKRITLHPGVPLHFVSRSPAYSGGSLRLESFSVNAGRVEWTIVTEKGKVIEGRARGEQPLPQWPDSWITLAIPMKIHIRERGNAPDFIVNIPGSIQEKE